MQQQHTAALAPLPDLDRIAQHHTDQARIAKLETALGFCLRLIESTWGPEVGCAVIGRAALGEAAAPAVRRA